MPHLFTERDRQAALDDADWLAAATRRQIAGCRKQAADGTVLFTPDGSANYDAHWTRDFYYMTQVADLIDPRELRAGIQYLLDGQREDGVIPDRRQADGLPVYEAGPVGDPVADFPLDNAAFMALLVADDARRTGDLSLFRRNADRLERAMAATPLSPAGLAHNDPARPHSPYGFTDCIGKTGEELFCSLLDWRAASELARLFAQSGSLPRAERFVERARQTAASLNRLWDDSCGAFLAASVDCRQPDVWGNAFCLSIGFPLAEARRRAIQDWLARNIDLIVERGQVRHLPAGMYWDRFLRDVPPGYYQNGGYWGTASGWLIEALAEIDPGLALRLFHDLVSDYRERGIHEWVNGATTRLQNYVASAANPLASIRRLLDA